MHATNLLATEPVPAKNIGLVKIVMLSQNLIILDNVMVIGLGTGRMDSGSGHGLKFA